MTSSRFLSILKLTIPLCIIISVLSARRFVFLYEPTSQRVESGAGLDIPAISLQKRQPDISTTIAEPSSVATPSYNITSSAINSVSILPWKPTSDTPYEVCFVTAVYGDDPKFSDQPPDVTEQRDANPSFRFFAFTNMPDLQVDGWTVIIKNSTQYRRYITRSRWPKFMGWKHPEVIKCQAVFYMDGFCGPKSKHAERYKQLARNITKSKYGIAQNKHEKGGSAMVELDRVVDRSKDIAKNVEASKVWFQAQPDFNPNCVPYANHYIGYDLKSQYWQKAAQFFWDRYSQELDSWRDQPLWCHTLDKFKIEPIRLGTFQALFRDYWKRMSKRGHRYDATSDRKGM